MGAASASSWAPPPFIKIVWGRGPIIDDETLWKVGLVLMHENPHNTPTQPVGTGHPPKVQPISVYAALALNSTHTQAARLAGRQAGRHSGVPC